MKYNNPNTLLIRAIKKPRNFKTRGEKRLPAIDFNLKQGRHALSILKYSGSIPPVSVPVTV